MDEQDPATSRRSSAALVQPSAPQKSSSRGQCNPFRGLFQYRAISLQPSFSGNQVVHFLGNQSVVSPNDPMQFYCLILPKSNHAYLMHYLLIHGSIAAYMH